MAAVLTWRGAPGELAIVLYEAPERKPAVLLAICFAGHLCDDALRDLQAHSEECSVGP